MKRGPENRPISGSATMTNEELDKIVMEVTERHWSWFKFFQRWRGTFWTCGVLAATSSALAASDKVAGSWSPYYAVLSSICIAVLGFTNPQRRANAYVAAWRMVSIALLHYKAGSSTVYDLVATVDRAEALIGEMDTKDINHSLAALAGNKTGKSHNYLGDHDRRGGDPNSQRE